MFGFLFGGDRKLSLIRELLEQRMRRSGYNDLEYRLEVKRALRDAGIVLCPMFLVLLIVIFFPEIILALPKLLMAKFI